MVVVAAYAKDVLMALDKQDVLRTDQRQPGMIGNYAVAQEWLSRLGNDRWLLIFYNYDVDLPHHDISAHEKAAQTDTTYDLKTFFPSDFRGSILITTRNSNLAETIGAQEHHLKRLDPTIEGLKVLLKRSKREQQHEGMGRRSSFASTQLTLRRPQCGKACTEI